MIYDEYHDLLDLIAETLAGATGISEVTRVSPFGQSNESVEFTIADPTKGNPCRYEIVVRPIEDDKPDHASTEYI